MSPSWRDRIEIFLGPEAVDLTLVRRGLRPQPGLAHTQACEDGANPSDWRPALSALDRALDALAWRGADGRVTLSNHFVRVTLVPSVDAAADERERVELARHHLRTVYGEHADAWEVVLGAVASGKDALAAAIDPELAGALKDILGRRQIRVQAVEPFLAAGYNAARKLLPAKAAWLAVVEPGRVCVAHLDADRWTVLRSQRSRQPLSEALPAALEQCRLAHGIEPDGGEVCLVTHGVPRVALPEGGRWQIRLVPAGAPAVAERRASR